jgi:hypothetical protein
MVLSVLLESVRVLPYGGACLAEHFSTVAAAACGGAGRRLCRYCFTTNPRVNHSICGTLMSCGYITPAESTL